MNLSITININIFQVEAFKMNLKRTKSELLLRREKHVSIAGGTSARRQWEGPQNVTLLTQQGETHSEDKLARRAELLSQLPASTKVETVLKLEPSEPTQFDNGQMPTLPTGNNGRLEETPGGIAGNSIPKPMSSYEPVVMAFVYKIISLNV